MRLVLAESGKGGIAVKADGDVVSLFSGDGHARVLVGMALPMGEVGTRPSTSSLLVANRP